MKITFLGTGTSQGVPVLTCQCSVCHSDDARDIRLRTALHIEIHNQSIVIDAGPDFRTQMLREKIQRLDAVLLTHAHHDHVAGLDDIRAYNFSQKMDMPIYGNAITLDIIKKYFDYAFVIEKYPGVPQFILKSINILPFNINGLEIIPIPIMHGNLQIIGYRIENVAYITDASFIPETSIHLLQGLDVLIINALRNEKHHSHFSLAQAIDVIERVKPTYAYITHISHQLGRYSEIQPKLPKNVFLAYDQLICEL
jgi:phosphoribosyl 1,2-cyclic phosphate phosphodiesterase